MSAADDPAPEMRGKRKGRKPKAEGKPAPPPSPPEPTAEEKAAALAAVQARYEPVCEAWRKLWPAALQTWSAYTQIREPSLWYLPEDLAREGVDGTLASIRLLDQVVQVNLPMISQYGLEGFGLEFLAHEIGHHVYAPGNLADQARCLHAMQKALYGLNSSVVQRTTNLYQDLLINDRLVRSAGLDLAAIYEKLNQRDAGAAPPSAAWKVYMRTYEHLWRCPAGRLAPPGVTEEMNGDAVLLARLIRHYAGDWLRGSKRFATVLYPYLLEDRDKFAPEPFLIYGMSDCAGACRCPEGMDGVPDGLLVVQDAEQDDGLGFDDLFGDGALSASKDGAKPGPKAPPPRPGTKDGAAGQHREPFEFRMLLESMGLNLDAHELTTRYYRERSTPHLIPFPQRKSPRSSDPLPEGYDSWDAGEDVQDLDLFGSLMRSPRLVPGVTTVQRVYGDAPGHEPAKTPLDLDVYVDCSGSMPDPSIRISYLALAGTILTLSALRAGARVQATLWAGPRQFETSGGFLRDEKKLMGIVTGYINGSTAFPLHVLRETYALRGPSSPPVHIVVISDEGIDTILQPDERKTSGEDLCRMALEKARAGGTLVLNLPGGAWPAREKLTELGFRIHQVKDWQDLVTFARRFVRENYPPD